MRNRSGTTPGSVPLASRVAASSIISWCRGSKVMTSRRLLSPRDGKRVKHTASTTSGIASLLVRSTAAGIVVPAVEGYSFRQARRSASARSAKPMRVSSSQERKVRR